MDLIETKRASNDEDVFAHFCREKTETGEYYADHMVFLMLAAHDTTTSASTMAACHLCNDHRLQSQLAAEVAEWPDELGFDHVFHSINGLISVFYETIRMHPPVPMFLRGTIGECEFGGVKVPPALSVYEAAGRSACTMGRSDCPLISSVSSLGFDGI